MPPDDSLTQNPRADPTKINSYFIDAFKWCQSLFPVIRRFPVLGRFWLAGDIIFRFRKTPPIKTILEFLHFWYLSFCKNFTPLNFTAKNSTFSVNTTLYQCVLTRRHLWRHIYAMWWESKSGSKLTQKVARNCFRAILGGLGVNSHLLAAIQHSANIFSWIIRPSTRSYDCRVLFDNTVWRQSTVYEVINHVTSWGALWSDESRYLIRLRNCRTLEKSEKWSRAVNWFPSIFMVELYTSFIYPSPTYI